MKKILVLVSIIMFMMNVSSAHCYVSYMWSGSSTSVGPSTVSSSFTGNKRFVTSGSGTVVFNTSVNFNSWTRLNFEEKANVKAKINFPSGRGEVGFYGSNKAEYITMNDSDIIYAEGSLSIDVLISNNSKNCQWNMILTNSKVNIGGTDYHPGDTFYSSPGAPETAVLIGNCSGSSITYCKSTPLPLTLLKYSGRTIEDKIELTWETAESTPISVLHSTDGSNWETIDRNALSPFYFKSKSDINFMRIMSIDSIYSQTLIFKIEHKKEEIRDIYGNLLLEEPFNQLYIKGGKKYFIIK